MADTAIIGAGENVADPIRDVAEQVHNLVSFWLGGFMYGIYAILFFGSVYLMTRAGQLQTMRQNTASMVFFTSMFSMFTVSTIYFGINMHRFVQAYALGASPIPSQPIYYFRMFGTWDNFSFPVLANIMVTHADILVIYRCFIVWKRNYYVIIVPILLMLLGISTNIIVMVWLHNPNNIPFETAHPFFAMIYPVNLAQNILTTGLIIFKIWRQHMQSQAIGVIVTSRVNMVTVVRIIVESAVIYTIQQMVLVILYSINHPAQLLLHGTVIPTVGIVFALMAARTQAARSEIHTSRYRNTTSIIASSNPQRNGGIIANVTTTKHVDYNSGSIHMDTLDHSSDRKV
ncbi:hypothetical protein FA15DRAFT_644784 [Coprinopsis marcescibilis]|uniref:Uncharacterized protein n=1 Tax=Coprinopsis marcescibilis TaxID=230819 RepID=A0A5C3KN89_COPMA|nr:hypothetical protein FA15DRAFT_644784 [Coprinopsis marcescibilis]